MMPGMDPRMMKQAMKRMGIKQHDIDAVQVIIRCSDKEIVIDSPSVARIEMMGQETFQVAGEISERSLAPEISDDDIATVAQQAGVTEEQARDAIKSAEGDLAKAIMGLQK